MPQLCDVLLGCMQQNQEPKREHSLLLREHRLGRDAAVLSEVMSFPVGYDGHLRLIGLHCFQLSEIPSVLSSLGYLRRRERQLSIIMQTTCATLPLIDADGTCHFLEHIKCCFWTFFVGPSSTFLHRALIMLALAGGNAPLTWLCLFQFIHSSYLPKHQRYVAKEFGVTGTDGKLKLNTTKSSLHGQRSRSSWTFCLLPTVGSSSLLLTCE